MQTTVTTVARVNQVDIQIIRNGEKRVAVKPICQALGIDHDSQRQKLNSDPILSSVTVLSTVTGADGKQYEMVTLPLKYVFGWLFRIDARNVKPEARAAVLRYQMECYDALYAYFTRHDEYLEWRDANVAEKLALYDAARIEFSEAKNRMQDARETLNRVRSITEDQYFADRAQLKLDFDGKEAQHE